MTGGSRIHIAAVGVMLGLAGCNGMPDMETAKKADLRQDYRTSIAHYQLLSNFGVAEAQVQLGKHYLHGRGVTQDAGKALAYLEQAEKSGLSARLSREVMAAKTEIGILALRGNLEDVPPERGLMLLSEAAAAGDARALSELEKHHPVKSASYRHKKENKDIAK